MKVQWCDVQRLRRSRHLALLLPVFGGQNGPRIVYYNTVLRVINALSEGLKTARIHRKSPSFAICHSSLLPAVLQNGEQKSGVTTRSVVTCEEYFRLTEE